MYEIILSRYEVISKCEMFQSQVTCTYAFLLIHFQNKSCMYLILIYVALAYLTSSQHSLKRRVQT
jgi:hypothetical protein